VREILKVNGMDPARHRAGPTWRQFLRSQAGAILASGFFTADLPGGTRAYVLAVIEHATRRIRIPGVTPYPAGERTTEQARNLLMDLGEQADRVKFMIRDRGPDFTAAFDSHLGIAQRVPGGTHRTVAGLDCERILRKPVLGGLINEYARAA
jgi:putative transposase